MNVAVIGLGNMGRFHVEKYSQIETVNLVAVCDPAYHGDEYPMATGTVPVYRRIEDLLDAQSIQAVSIASPTATHFEVAAYCLKNGCHCLVEKPIATTVEEADQLIQIARDHNVILTVGHIERFNPAVVTVKECIENGMLGDLSSISFRRNGPFPTQIEDADVVIDLAVHDIDIANYWLSALPDEVHGHKAALVTGGRPDHAEIIAKYDQTHVFFQVNWVTPIRVRTAVLTGKKGYIEMDFISKKVQYVSTKATYHQNKYNETVATYHESKMQSIPVKMKDSLEQQLRSFIAACQTNQPVQVTAKEARNALSIALKI